MNPANIDTPATLANLVDYQTHSIVSQALLKARGGNVTLFAFDEGEELSEHEAPFDALLFVVEGRAIVRVGGYDHPISGGEIMRLPANVPHAVQAVEQFKMLLIMLRSPDQSLSL